MPRLCYTLQGSKSIVIVPTVFVNNVAERGGISSAAVLSTICAGYKSGTAPDVRRQNLRYLRNQRCLL